MGRLELITGTCERVIPSLGGFDTIFADPPDNIGLSYEGYRDRLPERDYRDLVRRWLRLFVVHANTVWFSFNPKHTFWTGTIFQELTDEFGLEGRPCVQTFTFGQHRHSDLGTNHRCLWRLRRRDAPLFPDSIRVPSWRQENGDKRADPRGRVPGDHFDFPRVTGNSKQRRSYHPTQLHEGLVERALKLTTPEGGDVLDPFCGTGTTLRVCKRLGFNCTTIDRSDEYVRRVCEENGIAYDPASRLHADGRRTSAAGQRDRVPVLGIAG